jgi:hypothetical protein
MVPLIAFICVLEPVRQRKIFSIEKHKIFLFQVFDFVFSQKFSFYNSVWLRIRTFFRIRIHNNPGKLWNVYRSMFLIIIFIKIKMTNRSRDAWISRLRCFILLSTSAWAGDGFTFLVGSPPLGQVRKVFSECTICTHLFAAVIWWTGICFLEVFRQSFSCQLLVNILHFVFSNLFLNSGIN